MLQNTHNLSWTARHIHSCAYTHMADPKFNFNKPKRKVFGFFPLPTRSTFWCFVLHVGPCEGHAGKKRKKKQWEAWVILLGWISCCSVVLSSKQRNQTCWSTTFVALNNLSEEHYSTHFCKWNMQMQGTHFSTRKTFGESKILYLLKALS